MIFYPIIFIKLVGGGVLVILAPVGVRILDKMSILVVWCEFVDLATISISKWWSLLPTIVVSVILSLISKEGLSGMVIVRLGSITNVTNFSIIRHFFFASCISFESFFDGLQF